MVSCWSDSTDTIVANSLHSAQQYLPDEPR
jgi:hypothetical protein